MISSSVIFIIFGLHSASEKYDSDVRLSSIFCTGILSTESPYKVSIKSVFVMPSLPIFQVEVDEGGGRGATICTHWHTKGSLQYGAPLPFFQCWAHAQLALAGRSGCFWPF